MKIGLREALQEEAQQALNEYIISPGREIAKRWSNTSIYQYYPEYLAKAAELFGENSSFFKIIKSREHYFRGVNMRLKADATEENSETLLLQALKEQGRALKWYNIDPAHIYNELGLLHRRLDQKEKELEFFQSAVEESPRWGLALTNLAYTYRRMDNYEKAEQLYKKTIKLDESLALSYYNLATLYRKMKKWDLAIENYHRTIAKDPTFGFGDPYYNIAYIYRNDSTKFHKAEEMALKAIEYSQDKSYEYNLLGLIYINNGYLDKAIPIFEKALAIDKNFILANYNLAYVYLEKGMVESAKKAAQQFVVVAPQNQYAHYILAQALALNKEYDKAIKSLGQSLDLKYDDYQGIREDPYFKPLLKMDAFQKLMDRF